MTDLEEKIREIIYKTCYPKVDIFHTGSPRCGGVSYKAQIHFVEEAAQKIAAILAEPPQC